MQLSCDKLYRNSVALSLQAPFFQTSPMPPHTHLHDHAHGNAPSHAPHHPASPAQRQSVLAWPAWRRVLAVLPVVLALWLAVAWANMGLPAW